LFATNAIANEDINKKSIELQEIITKISEKEERWFELSAKLES
jgi:ATP-binding cassette subfamily F protein uup